MCQISTLSRKFEFPALFSKQLVQIFCSGARFGTLFLAMLPKSKHLRLNQPLLLYDSIIQSLKYNIVNTLCTLILIFLNYHMASIIDTGFKFGQLRCVQSQIKFIYCEKTTKFGKKNFNLILTLLRYVKTNRNIFFFNFLAFSEKLNFKKRESILLDF